MRTHDVALLTDHRYTAGVAAEGDWYLRNILGDDRLLRDALTRRGLTSARVDWADPEIDWTRFRYYVAAVCHPVPVYGRVDMVRDNDGRLAVMELEMIEPELWLRSHPPAAEAFATSIMGFLDGPS